MGHIVQVVGDGAAGGGTTYVSELTAALVRGGYNTTIITAAGSFLGAQARSLGADVIGLPFASRWNTLALAVLLQRCLKGVCPTIVHAHGARGGLPTALIANSASWDFIYTVHGLHFTIKRQPIQTLGWMAERLCMRRARKVIFVADHDRAAALASGLLTGVAHHVSIPNAALVDVDPASPADKMYDIGFLGRLAAPKHPLLLCDILVAMRPLRPSLVVIGDGVLGNEFRARADEFGLAGQVTMTGELPRSEALHTLARCRTLALPSFREGQPLAVIEAAHLGVPVVVSALPGMHEIVDDGETGFLVPTTDVASYAERLRRLLVETDLAARISMAARRKAGQEFGFERIVDAHLRFYGYPIVIPVSRAAEGSGGVVAS